MKRAFTISVAVVVQAICFGLAMSQVPAQQLARVVPRKQHYENGSTKVFYGSDVSLQDALQINDFLTKNVLPEPVPKVFKRPFPGDLFLASAWAGTPGADLPRVFLLLRKEGANVHEVQRTRGWSGDWILEPTFFVGRDRILIVAELGSEEYIGLQAFEFRDNRLRYLGSIDVGRRGKQESPFVSPLADASAEYSNAAYQMVFRGELFDVSQRVAKRISKTGDSVRFTLKGDRFVPVLNQPR